ncbi:MAG: MBL fold metallo-hydrolase [Culicoidibacterales bacterium]
MKINQITLGKVMTNCFVVEIGKRVIIVDPVLPDFQIDELIGDKTVEAILLTHGHFDHILGTDYYSEKYSAPVFIHRNDVICLSDSEANLALSFGIGNQTQKTIPSVLQGKEGIVPIDSAEISYTHVPGHSRGHVIYHFNKQNIIFVGDLVFFESIGRYDLPRCSESDMKKSIQQFFQNDEFQKKNPILYPGHGPKTMFEYEMKNNPMVKLFL